MPFARFESANEAETHNNNQRSNAKARWTKLQQERRPYGRARKPRAQGEPARKPAARLAVRVADYVRFIDDNKGDAKVRMRRESGGFHKPGSMQ